MYSLYISFAFPSLKLIPCRHRFALPLGPIQQVCVSAPQHETWNLESLLHVPIYDPKLCVLCSKSVSLIRSPPLSYSNPPIIPTLFSPLSLPLSPPNLSFPVRTEIQFWFLFYCFTQFSLPKPIQLSESLPVQPPLKF